jgi:hypothetical protein
MVRFTEELSARPKSDKGDDSTSSSRDGRGAMLVGQDGVSSSVRLAAQTQAQDLGSAMVASRWEGSREKAVMLPWAPDSESLSA